MRGNQRKWWDKNSTDLTRLELGKIMRKAKDSEGWRKKNAEPLVAPSGGQFCYRLGIIPWLRDMRGDDNLPFSVYLDASSGRQ